jgi:hypothetical protein
MAVGRQSVYHLAPSATSIRTQRRRGQCRQQHWQMHFVRMAFCEDGLVCDGAIQALVAHPQTIRSAVTVSRIARIVGDRTTVATGSLRIGAVKRRRPAERPGLS